MWDFFKDKIFSWTFTFSWTGYDKEKEDKKKEEPKIWEGE